MSASDVADFSVFLSRQDGQFRQIGDQPSFRTTGGLSLGSTVRLDRFLPASLGLAFPVTVNYARNADKEFGTYGDLGEDSPYHTDQNTGLPWVPASYTLTAPDGTAYELDAAPKFERFFLITADRAFDAQMVMDAARSVATQPGEDVPATLPLPPGLWLALPGRNELAGAATATGQPQPWRPLSLSPGASEPSRMAARMRA